MSNSTVETKTPNAVVEQTVALNPVDWPLPNVAPEVSPVRNVMKQGKGKGKADKADKGNGKVDGPLAKFDRILRLAESEFAKSDLERVAAEKPLSNQPVADRLAKSLTVWAIVNGSGDAKLDRASHKAFVAALDSSRQVKMPDGKQATLSIRSIKYARPDASGVPTEQRYGAVLTRSLDQGERKVWVTERMKALNRWLKSQ